MFKSIAKISICLAALLFSFSVYAKPEGQLIVQLTNFTQNYVHKLSSPLCMVMLSHLLQQH